MRSATREAMTSTRAVLAELGGAVDLGVGAEIFASGRAIARASQLLNLLADPTADTAGKKVLIDRVFAGQSDATRAVLTAVAGSRWSSQGDLLAGIEDAAVRAVAATADQSTSIEAELFAFETAVRSDAGLEEPRSGPSSAAPTRRAPRGAPAGRQGVAADDHHRVEPRAAAPWPPHRRDRA